MGDVFEALFSIAAINALPVHTDAAPAKGQSAGSVLSSTRPFVALITLVAHGPGLPSYGSERRCATARQKRHSLRTLYRALSEMEVCGTEPPLPVFKFNGCTDHCASVAKNGKAGS